MRTLIDTICPGCGDAHTDVWIDTHQPQFPMCDRCRIPHERHRRYVQAACARSDSIPGGLWIEHGLCHADGSPRRYDSHSDIAKEAKRRGLVNLVEHTDRSDHTQRFV